jgi:hypothetical protein
MEGMNDTRRTWEETIMDTSQEYIKMCEKAREIQDSRPNSEIDIEYSFGWVLPNILKCNKCGISRFSGTYCSICGSLLTVETDEGYLQNLHNAETSDERNVWLPHQDQLQEMLDYKYNHERYTKTYHLVWDFYEFVMGYADEGDKSMEMCWLAFVMLVKYGKEWDGHEWEVI